MGDILTPLPVKLFIALTYHDSNVYNTILEGLKEKFGSIDEAYHYDFSQFTDHYEDEIGKPLKKTIVTFDSLIAKDEFPELKIYSNQIEKKNADENEYPIKRNINIDPGYLTEAKVVLMTTKNFSHRIYISKGIFGELALNFRGESFSKNSWTYPDYASTEIIEFFNDVRERYRKQLADIADFDNE